MVEIYTDGSSRGNPGPGGYGVVLLSQGHRKEISAGYRLTTNNRMELLAAIMACEYASLKGLYKKARAGEIKDFTGINSPYEVPQKPNLIIQTEQCSVDEAANTILKYLFETIKINL